MSGSNRPQPPLRLFLGIATLVVAASVFIAVTFGFFWGATLFLGFAATVMFLVVNTPVTEYLQITDENRKGIQRIFRWLVLVTALVALAAWYVHNHLGF